MSDDGPLPNPLELTRKYLQFRARDIVTDREVAMTAIVEIAHLGRIELVNEAIPLLSEGMLQGVEYLCGEILKPGGDRIALTLSRMGDETRANLVPVALEFRRQLRRD